MTSSASIRCIHLSDIHFYESADGIEGNFRHSLAALRNIEAILEREQPDLLIVTGDVTNLGDKLSLDRVYQWLHDRIYVQGAYLGLRSQERKLRTLIVPGNHDAFNAPSHGATHKRWQSALTNFYNSFQEYADFWDPKARVGYQIVEKGGTRLFICFADSCYLGDPETEFLPGALKLTRVAKGKISQQQSGRLLELHDEGLRGALSKSDGTRLAAADFRSSLKILVMHHYLFEPSESKSEPLLQLYDKRTVFQNLAMCDFDMLLCGHKHVAETRILSYLDHFDPRGKVRFALNQLRRTLGIKALPLASVNGKRLGRMYRFVLGMLLLGHSSPVGLSEADADRVIDVFDRTLNDPKVLRKELLRILSARAFREGGLFDEIEIASLHSRIVNRYSPDEWRRLVDSANKLRALVAKLAGRPFAHIVSGSSAKASEMASRTRTLNVYSFEDCPADRAFVVNVKRYGWEPMAAFEFSTEGAFAGPLETEIRFPYERVGGLIPA